MPDILIREMCKLESGKSYRALFKELRGKFVVVVEQIESYADRGVKIYSVEELPPHGDLCDRSVLLAQYDAEHVGAPGRARGIIEEAPAVIPAERSEP